MPVTPASEVPSVRPQGKSTQRYFHWTPTCLPSTLHITAVAQTLWCPGGGEELHGICKKRRNGQRSELLSFLHREHRFFFFPWRDEGKRKRWTINSGTDIKLGHRLKFEFQDITADMKPPNRIQWNWIPLFCAVKLPLSRAAGRRKNQ